jgi:hypothetical protein
MDAFDQHFWNDEDQAHCQNDHGRSYRFPTLNCALAGAFGPVRCAELGRLARRERFGPDTLRNALGHWIGVSAYLGPEILRSQRAACRNVGSALAHALIEGLRLCVGRYAEEVLQQLAAAPVGLQRLAVITELLVAEHQAPI